MCLKVQRNICKIIYIYIYIISVLGGKEEGIEKETTRQMMLVKIKVGRHRKNNNHKMPLDKGKETIKNM